MRGIAACMVVVFHATQNWSIVAHGNDSGSWQGGASGVDIFFVISGFVMATSAIGDETGPVAALNFMKRRLVRVMPLYWLVTTVIVVKSALGLVHNAAIRTGVPFGFAVCSYLLIPHKDFSGSIAPLVSPGWTLSFEMFFYLCFSAALFVRWPVVPTLTVLLSVLALIGGFREDSWPTVTVLLNPLLLEFLAGLWLGRMMRDGWAPSVGWVAATGAASLLALWLLPEPSSWGFYRMRWGALAFLVVQASVVLEGRIGRRIPRWVLLIGDASYSIYLTHAPLLGVWTFALKRAHVLVAGRVRLGDEAVMMAVCLLLSTGVGILTYVVVERPMNDVFRKLTGLRRPVQTEAASGR